MLSNWVRSAKTVQSGRKVFAKAAMDDIPISAGWKFYEEINVRTKAAFIRGTTTPIIQCINGREQMGLKQQLRFFMISETTEQTRFCLKKNEAMANR